MTSRWVSRWWIIFFLLLFTGPPKFRVREADASVYEGLDWAAAAQLVVWLLGAAFVAYNLFWSSDREKLHLNRVHKLSLCVIASMFVSIFVSLSPSLTAFKAFQVLTAFLFSCLFIQKFGPEKFFRLVFYGSVILCALVTVYYFVAPNLVLTVESSGELRLRGQAIYEVEHPALFGVLLGLILPGQITFRRLLAILFCGVILLASLTRVDWLALALALLAILLLRPEIPSRRIVSFGWFFSPFAAVWAWQFLSRSRDLTTWYDLSERGGLWAFIVLTTVNTSPLLGNGFIAGSRLLGMDYVTELASGHSIFVDMFAGCGLVGLILFLLLCSVMAVRVTQTMLRNRDAMSFLIGVLFWALLLVGCVGGDIEATPFGFLFWGLIPAMVWNHVTSYQRTIERRLVTIPNVMFASLAALLCIALWLGYAVFS